MFMSYCRPARLIPLACVLLAACSMNTPQKPGKSVTAPEWQQHQQIVKKITRFQTRGAFAWLTDDQKIYARFHWQQTAPDRYRLLLTNPLGSTELQLDVQGNVAQIVDNKGKRYTSDNAEKMIAQLTGMDIPLENLHQWIMGLPGQATDYTLDDKYQLRQLTWQRGGDNVPWSVNILRYDSGASPALPSALELRTSSQRIKLKMDSWTLN